jgi:hypothetical protein
VTSSNGQITECQETGFSSLNKSSVVVPKMAQLISDVVSFSEHPYRLEDALDLSDTPRYVCHEESEIHTVYLCTIQSHVSCDIPFSMLSDCSWKLLHRTASFMSMLHSHEISLRWPTEVDAATHKNGWKLKTNPIISPPRHGRYKRRWKRLFPKISPCR